MTANARIGPQAIRIRTGVVLALVAADAGSLASKVEALTSDLSALEQTRASLPARVSGTLGDVDGFVRRLEAAYRGMWRQWCANQNDD